VHGQEILGGMAFKIAWDWKEEFGMTSETKDSQERRRDLSC